MEKKEIGSVFARLSDPDVEHDEIIALITGGAYGNAELFVNEYKQMVKIISDRECYIFDTTTQLFKLESNRAIINLIAEFLKQTILVALSKVDRAMNIEFTKLTKLLEKVYDHTYDKKVYEFSYSGLYDPEFPKQLNRSKNLLAINDNKVIDLKTLSIRRRTMDDKFSIVVPCDFVEETPHADKFFKEVMKGDDNDVEYLQKELGYCVTGETSERTILLFYGVGANAKSATLEIIHNFMGELYQAVDKKVFIKDGSSNSHTSHLMQLVGARVAVFSETDKHETLNMAMIKKLRGEEEISARELYGKQTHFKPMAKYILVTNKKPTFDITDQASLDTIRYVPFESRFVDKPDTNKGEYQKDPKFVEKLKTVYLDEVFTWICKGAKKFYDEVEEYRAIRVPEKFKELTNEYISELDTVKQYIEACCKQLTDDEAISPLYRDNNKMARTVLYSGYKAWCNTNGVDAFDASDFYKQLGTYGFNTVIIKGTRYIKNLIVDDS